VNDIDRAQENEQRDRALCLAAARNAPSLPATGAGHWCEASVPEGAHFCDCDCREMFEKTQRMERINGKR